MTVSFFRVNIKLAKISLWFSDVDRTMEFHHRTITEERFLQNFIKEHFKILVFSCVNISVSWVTLHYHQIGHQQKLKLQESFITSTSFMKVEKKGNLCLNSKNLAFLFFIIRLD